MATQKLVNNIDHKDTKIITERSATYGDDIWFTQTFPAEFRSVQAYYPIFFTKDENTGKFLPVALFGFEQNENLFINDGLWHVPYIPLMHARAPFLIGKQTLLEDGVEKLQRVLFIDENHPRVNTEQGAPLFLEFGANAPYLENMANMMETLHHGMQDNDVFIGRLVELELLESFTLDVELNDKSKHQMLGFYTINEDKLAELSDDDVAQLHKDGHLQAIYMAIASQSNVTRLLLLKNAALGL
ncbi:SapC family protein [Psychrosphaera sp. B3R10]|uniref:SapC family protein n=1 Tax=Psychrosphaera algicola TaxID=3023714 RepID=A0ABT5FAC2_9GAMM|nr:MULTISPECIES: SapC family protein [unclassified Psychrosphaera]MBU2881150.1 SapC family protein [Psychrosphaera sp. I2R16]MBU2988255.1 SapC family protein [Psychrosphaera sp. B3R10]MDC2888356.1 SapC family protein [Psychrosphaera sp. G1-22]MDO6718464.1 SapC family protein [Psychrosphaera sp. 1_MG-2023]